MTSKTAQAFEQLASGIYLEGLAVDERRGMVWYSDVVAGGVHGIGRDGKALSFNHGRMWTGGVMLNADGAVLSSGAGGIMWNHPDSGKSGWLIDEIDGQPINGINEMMPDGTGGIFFGTLDIEMVIRGESPRPTAIYRLTTDGELQRVSDNLGFTNGMMFDAVHRRFYCNDTFNRTWAFDVAADFSLQNQRPLLEKRDVDGMALDAEGNVWITGFQSGSLTRVHPDGTVLAPVQTPAEAVTQVRFGGVDHRDLYITCVPPDGGESLKQGELPSEPRSLLYRGRSPVPGMPLQPASFKLD